MGMYTGIRFKGYVKEEFRSKFESIAMHGEWEDSEDTKFKDFGDTYSRASFIPCGSLSYMPDEWEKDYIDENGNKQFAFANYYIQVATDGFEREYNENTGYWAFQCSLKNYEDEIEAFFKLIPYFIEKIEYLEYYYETWTYSYKYELIDGTVALTNDRYKKYGYDDRDY